MATKRPKRIRPTPAKPVVRGASTAAQSKVELARRNCWGCDTRKLPAEFKYLMASLLDETEYACSDRCFRKWSEAHPVSSWPTRNEKGNPA